LLTSLKGKSGSKECIFLDGNKCSVYNVRPTQCRTYPFWPQYLLGKAEWRAESIQCEGISLSLLETKSYIKPVDILQNLIIHQVHAKGHLKHYLNLVLFRTANSDLKLL